MKSKLVKLSVCIALAVMGIGSISSVAQAQNPVTQCSLLKREVAKHTHSFKRHLAKHKKISGAMKKQLKAVQKKYSVSCEEQPVCGNEQPALCEASGADFCIQMIKEHTYASVKEMISLGGRFLYKGECSNGGANYGAPEIL